MCRGSIWRKWDLHIHTPISFTHEFKFINKEEGEKYNNNIWEKYIIELEKIDNVDVLGIADYFTIDGYKKVLEYYQSNRLQKFKLILPNIELRLDKFVEEKRLNYHVIFSNEVEPSLIEREFLEELHVKAPNAEPRSLNKDNIIEIGKILKEQEASFRNRENYIVGCENITVSLDEIIDILKGKASIFEGKYLLVLEEEGWDSIHWAGQDHLTRKEILVRSHALFSSNSNTRDWCLGKKHSAGEEFIKEFCSLKPCIHGSDAHSFEKLCKPDQDRFCWIKADPTFEGLKQIVYEPEDRVRIQPENPEYVKNIYTLESIRIENSYINKELSLEEQEIHINRNLVAVTGGKGNGKTALLDLLANCFGDRCQRAGVDKNSFVQRIETEKKDLSTTIGFIGEDLENFSKELLEEKFIRDSRIIYLPQGKIEEYCGDREKLDRKIEEIIFDNKEVLSRGYKEQFDRLRDEIDQLTKEIEKLNRNIFELEEESKRDIILDVENKKGIKEGELNNKHQLLKKHTEHMEKGIKEKIENLKDQETKLRVKHSKLESVITNLDKLESDLMQFQKTFNENREELNKELTELELEIEIPLLDVRKFIELKKKIIEDITNKVTEVIEQITDREKQLSLLTGSQKAQVELLKEVESIKTEIETFAKMLDKLEEKKQNIIVLDKERKDKYILLLSKYMEWKEYYEKVIEAFSVGRSQIMSGIDFKSSIFFNKDKFLVLGLDLFDLRKINQDEIKNYADELQTLILESSSDDLGCKIEEFMKKISEQKQLLKSTRNNFDFDMWIYGNYFSLSTEVLFRDRLLEKLSIGQKGTVLLKLFLAEGDYPLIIDQPEESLDNKFIFDELVVAFRDAKKRRQVLIATNNANLVVNTDAEQIIVAEYENNKISYKFGALENLKIRKEIMPILEGGREAFKKREEKYGI